MCKYIAQIKYFSSILSLVFVLSHANLKETNEENQFILEFCTASGV